MGLDDLYHAYEGFCGVLEVVHDHERQDLLRLALARHLLNQLSQRAFSSIALLVAVTV